MHACVCPHLCHSACMENSLKLLFPPTCGSLGQLARFLRQVLLHPGSSCYPVPLFFSFLLSPLGSLGMFTHIHSWYRYVHTCSLGLTLNIVFLLLTTLFSVGLRVSYLSGRHFPHWSISSALYSLPHFPGTVSHHTALTVDLRDQPAAVLWQLCAL